MRFGCRKRIDADGAVRMTLIGELDIAVTGELTRQLDELERSRARVRLDLSELGFIDLGGLDAILAALARARRTGWALEVDSQVSRSVERILDLGRLGQIVWPAPTPCAGAS
jgi:anti-anti-sigma factor